MHNGRDGLANGKGLMQTVSDEQLMLWLKDGDESCLAALFERHHAGLYNFCCQLTRDRALAEDVTQEAFFRVLRARRSYRGGQFKSWLFSIARNLAFDQLRRSNRQQPLAPQYDDEQIDERDPERSLAGNQSKDLLVRALAQLPLAAREVILLGRFEFEDYDALGAALDCSAGAAKVRLHRAMKQLKTLIAELTEDAHASPQ